MGKVFWINSNKVEEMFLVCVRNCADVPGCCFFPPNPITRQNLNIGQFCKTSDYDQCQQFLISISTTSFHSTFCTMRFIEFYGDL